MIALDETSSQPHAASPRGPVFVDASGRRLRRVKLIGLGALGLVAAYVLLLLVAFISGSNVSAPYLPLPAAAEAPAPQPVPSAPASSAAGLPAVEAPAAGPPALPAAQAAVAAPPAAPVAPPDNRTAVQASPRVEAPAPAAVPSAPGMSGSAPGQATRPSAPPRP